MSEEFKAWWKDQPYFELSEKMLAWIAWQASREAIRLPEPHFEFDGDPAPEMFASEVYAAVGVKP